MKENFFEGKDFTGTKFKALIPKYYPLQYQKYIAEETKLLQKRLGGAARILEAGVGIGRLIPALAPLVTGFVGIDNATLMLNEAQKIAKSYPNVKIIKSDLEKISSLFPVHYFDFSLCVWNTLGNVQDEVLVLRELSRVTAKSIFITVYRKGTITQRKRWYQKVGIKIAGVDLKKEIFYSESGLKSKSYSLIDIKELAKATNLQIKDFKILNGVMLFVELVKSKKINRKKRNT